MNQVGIKMKDLIGGGSGGSGVNEVGGIGGVGWNRK